MGLLLRRNKLGLQRIYLLKSLDEPVKIVSLSLWESQSAAQAAFADPSYASLLAGLRLHRIAAPERLSYNLLGTI